MADPGALLPSDIYGSHAENVVPLVYTSPSFRDIDSSHVASSSSGVGSSFEDDSEKRSKSKTLSALEKRSQAASDTSGSADAGGTNSSKGKLKTSLDDFTDQNNVEKLQARELPSRPTYPFGHARSPSWTEGVSSPAARRMKVKDVSQYMIDATKGNPQLAQNFMMSCSRVVSLHLLIYFLKFIRTSLIQQLVKSGPSMGLRMNENV